MEHYISKSDVLKEIEKLVDKGKYHEELDCAYCGGKNAALYALKGRINTLEVKEFQKKKLYVVTRCEEHSDYVEKVFFSEKKAEEYCKQFEGNEDAYGRNITEIEVDCTLEVKEVDLEDSVKETLAQKYIDYTFKRHNIDPESKEGQLIYYAYMHGMNQCLNQLKVQKGE